MNMAIVWPCWLLAFIASFGFFEGYAIMHHAETLSAWVWRLASAWPPAGVVFGVVVGFLACHFFWPNEGLKKKDPPKS